MAAVAIEPSWVSADSAAGRTSNDLSGAGSTGHTVVPRRSAHQQLVVNGSVVIGPAAGQSVATTAEDAVGRAASPPATPSVVLLPQVHVGQDRFDLRQQWEGTVQSASGDDIVAVLRDLTDPSRPEEEVVIGFDEVSLDDRALVGPGAIFYWSIGYRTSRFGQVERVSTIKFRRLPAWSKRDVRRIEERTRELMDFLGVTGEVGRAQGE